MALLDRLFSGVTDDFRPCYIRASALRQRLESDKILDALLDRLEVPGKPAQNKRLLPEQKLDAIVHQVEHFQKAPTSRWRGVNTLEVLAAAIWSSDLGPRLVAREIFFGVGKEAQLLQPVVDWLAARDHEVHAEISLGKKRVDVLGYKKAGFLGFGERFVAVELKNDVKEMERAFDQISTYAAYAHAVYLAITPALGAQYLDEHVEANAVRQYDPNILHRKLEMMGIGLLLVEGTQVTEGLRPKASSGPDKMKTAEVLHQFKPSTRRDPSRR